MKWILAVLFLGSSAFAKSEVCKFNFDDEGGKAYIGDFTFTEKDSKTFDIDYNLQSPEKYHQYIGLGHLRVATKAELQEFLNDGCRDAEDEFNLKFCDKLDKMDVISDEQGDPTDLFRFFDKNGKVLVRIIAPDAFNAVPCVN